MLFDTLQGALLDSIESFFDAQPAPIDKKRTMQFRLHDAIYHMAKHAVPACESTRYTDSDLKLKWIETELTIAGCFDATELLQKVLFKGKHGLQSTMYNHFYRDGRYHYDSTSYMRVIIRQFLVLGLPIMGMHIKESTEETYESFNLYEDNRFPTPFIVDLNFRIDTGQILPSFGDTEEAENRHPVEDSRIDGLPDYDPRMETTAALVPAAKNGFKRFLMGIFVNQLEEFRSILGNSPLLPSLYLQIS